MKNKFPRTAIIVLNYNGFSHTKECVESLEQITYPNYRLIIVDNNGGRNDAKRLRSAYGAKHIVLENDQNLGYAGGNNVGIRYALTKYNADYVLILNNDAVVHPSFLEKMTECATASSKIGAIGSVILRYDKRDEIETIGLKLLKNGLAYKRTSTRDPLFCPSGACVLYSAEMLHDVEMNGEYFDEDFFLFGEDVDLGFRAILRGYETALAYKAIVFHKVSATTKERSPLSIYYGHRNTPLMILKNFPSSFLFRYSVIILFIQLITPIYYLLIDPRHVWVVTRAKLHALYYIPRILRKRRVIQSTRVISDKELLNWFST